MTTRARVLTLNCRRSTYAADALLPSRRWSNRKPYMIKFLKEVAPSIIAVQECTGRQFLDITGGLGANWTGWGEPSNRQVIWDSAKWTAVDAKAQVIYSRTKQEATHVRLQSRTTGAAFWVSSVHLTQGDTNATWRGKEISAIIGYVKSLPGGNVGVIAGDLNSSSESAEVRGLARTLGYKSLRLRTANSEITDEQYSTFNGWKKTATTARWIDDVLTPPAVDPYGGGVQLDCLRVFPICASDHNGLLARVEF